MAALWPALLENMILQNQAVYTKLWSELVEAGLMEADGDFLKLTNAGRLVADAIGERTY